MIVSIMAGAATFCQDSSYLSGSIKQSHWLQQKAPNRFKDCLVGH